MRRQSQLSEFLRLAIEYIQNEHDAVERMSERMGDLVMRCIVTKEKYISESKNDR